MMASRTYSSPISHKGYDLIPALLALAHWGDMYKPHPKGARLTFVDRNTGKPIQRMRARSADGDALDARELDWRRGPALAD